MTILTISFIFLSVLFSNSLYSQNIEGTFDGKMERGMGHTLLKSRIWLPTASQVFHNIESDNSVDSRAMASNFLAEFDNTSFAVFFSAETAGHSMLIQCLVDGQIVGLE